jgi:Trypsin-like peptidase domain
VAESKWPELDWDEVVDRVTPIVFRVYAGRSAGTAFVVSLGTEKATLLNCAILATADHVLATSVDTADKVRLVSADRQKTFDADVDEMRIQPLGERIHDTMLILLKSKKPILEQEKLLPMLQWDLVMPKGSPIGWMGYPGMMEPELCFFHGHVSGFVNDPPTYLIDGVAISGVSGGPAFNNKAHLIGLVSAYIPSRVDPHTTLPGLMALVPIGAIRLFMEANMSATIL